MDFILHPNTRTLQVLDEEATGSCRTGGAGGSAPFVSRVQQCFAVRPAADGLLDVARAAFCRVTEAVHEAAERTASESKLPGLKVSYSARRGFHLTLPAAAVTAAAAGSLENFASAAGAAGGAGGRGRGRGRGGYPAPSGLVQGSGPPPQLRLPPGLLLVERRARGALLLTSHELNALNARLRDAANDCLLLTRQVGPLGTGMQPAAGGQRAS